MTTLRQFWSRLAAFFHKRDLDRELDEELAAHIELATEDYLHRGMSPAEARRQALIEFGGIESSKELHRDSRGLPWLDGLTQDLRFSIRSLLRSRGVTVTALATLALGIGINVIVFTITTATLFNGFPHVRGNNRILYLSTRRSCCASYPDFEDWRAAAKSFEGMAAVHGLQKSFSDDGSFPETRNTTDVSANTFTVLGEKPILGRDFQDSDEAAGAPRVVILRYSFWESRYGRNPAVVGHSVRINGELATVIGVMPPGFSFPQNQDLWMPLLQKPEILKRENRGLWFAFGRLAPGATLKSARAEMETIGRRLEIAYTLTNQGLNAIPHVQTFHEFFIGTNATAIYEAMLVAVGFVLMIACANLANLFLARAIGRSTEISIRIALGAGRWRLLRQLLVESMILSALGGTVAWWIAKVGVGIYARAASGASVSDAIAGNWFDNMLDYTMDFRVFGYLVLISIATAILFGLAPAARLSKLDVNGALKDGARGATAGRRGKHLSTLLVIGEMALAMVLLAGAGVMVRSFFNIYSADMGVKTQNVLAALIGLPSDRYPRPEAQISFYDRLTDRLAALLGVDTVAIASSLPSLGNGRVSFELPDFAPVDDARRPTIAVIVVGPNYFRTMGTALRSGRDFDQHDTHSRAPVALVNVRFAAEHWPGQDPIGKRLRLFDGRMPQPWLTVVGVAPDIVQNDSTRQDFDALVYLPYLQRPAASMWVMVRTKVPPGGLANEFRRELHAVDPDLPLGLGPFALGDYLAWSYQYRGVSGALFLMFAGVALLLASIGLYAVIAHSVSRRTQEIGIRMAIGATARDIRKLVLREGMVPLGVGLAIGLFASFGVNWLLRSQLVQVSPSDPITLAFSAIVLLAAGVLGCSIPARRAMRVDPVIALRHE